MDKLEEILNAYRNGERGLPTYEELMATAPSAPLVAVGDNLPELPQPCSTALVSGPQGSEYRTLAKDYAPAYAQYSANQVHEYGLQCRRHALAGQVAPPATVEPLTDEQIAVPRDRIEKLLEYSDKEYVPNTLFAEFSALLAATPPTSKATDDAKHNAALNRAFDEGLAYGKESVRKQYSTDTHVHSVGDTKSVSLRAAEVLIKSGLKPVRAAFKPEPMPKGWCMQMAALEGESDITAGFEPSCCCGQPSTLGTVHRTDGPCFIYEATSKADTGEPALMTFDPMDGMREVYPSEAKQYRKWHGPVAWLFNPYTGEKRNAHDVGSDPTGFLILAPGQVLKSATPSTIKAEPTGEQL